jgi:Brp/Blh family beta-carotene 15,15'-monooxygenase
MRNLRYVMLALGALLALGHKLIAIPEAVDYAFFGLLIVFTGIPHGAVDHLVEARNRSLHEQKFLLPRFLFIYVLQMAVYGLLWYLFPALSLLLFLILSAWHFGESDTEPAPVHWLWDIFKAALGAAVLFFLLLREPFFTAELINRISRSNALSNTAWQWMVVHQTPLLFVLFALILAFHAAAQWQKPIPLGYKRWIPWIAVMAVAYFLPLLPAFALYFGGFHAINTFHHIHLHLGKDTSPWLLWRKTMPFTLLALVVLLITGWLWWKSFQHLDPLPVLFIFIAIITLPHLLVMSKMFRFSAQLRAAE